MRRKTVRFHYWTGGLLAVFILVHLVNHLAALWGAPAHLMVMDTLRVVYRHRVIEALLLLAVAAQVVSGSRLYWQTRHLKGRPAAEQVQRYTGLYMAFFLLVHTGAVLTGRRWFGLDTNLYFGAAGMNTFPFSLFFIPYYFLAVAAVFLHLASVHVRKGAAMFGFGRVRTHAIGIAGVGVAVAVLIIFAMTNRFQGLAIPSEYLQALGM